MASQELCLRAFIPSLSHHVYVVANPDTLISDLATKVAQVCQSTFGKKKNVGQKYIICSHDGAVCPGMYRVKQLPLKDNRFLALLPGELPNWMEEIEPLAKRPRTVTYQASTSFPTPYSTQPFSSTSLPAPVHGDILQHMTSHPSASVTVPRDSYLSLALASQQPRSAISTSGAPSSDERMSTQQYLAQPSVQDAARTKSMPAQRESLPTLQKESENSSSSEEDSSDEQEVPKKTSNGKQTRKTPRKRATPSTPSSANTARKRKQTEENDSSESGSETDDSSEEDESSEEEAVALRQKSAPKVTPAKSTSAGAKPATQTAKAQPAKAAAAKQHLKKGPTAKNARGAVQKQPARKPAANTAATKQKKRSRPPSSSSESESESKTSDEETSGEDIPPSQLSVSAPSRGAKRPALKPVSAGKEADNDGEDLNSSADIFAESPVFASSQPQHSQTPAKSPAKKSPAVSEDSETEGESSDESDDVPLKSSAKTASKAGVQAKTTSTTKGSSKPPAKGKARPQSDSESEESSSSEETTDGDESSSLVDSRVNLSQARAVADRRNANKDKASDGEEKKETVSKAADVTKSKGRKGVKSAAEATANKAVKSDVPSQPEAAAPQNTSPADSKKRQGRVAKTADKNTLTTPAKRTDKTPAQTPSTRPSESLENSYTPGSPAKPASVATNHPDGPSSSSARDATGTTPKMEPGASSKKVSTSRRGKKAEPQSKPIVSSDSSDSSVSESDVSDDNKETKTASKSARADAGLRYLAKHSMTPTLSTSNKSSAKSSLRSAPPIGFSTAALKRQKKQSVMPVSTSKKRATPKASRTPSRAATLSNADVQLQKQGASSLHEILADDSKWSE